MCNLGEGLIEKYTALGVAQGAEQERINTERERKEQMKQGVVQMKRK